MPKYTATLLQTVTKRVEVEVEAESRDGAFLEIIRRGMDLMCDNVDNVRTGNPFFNVNDINEVSSEQPRPFDVSVIRESQTVAIVRVDAVSSSEAQRKALEKVSSLDFKGKKARATGQRCVSAVEAEEKND